MRSIPSPCLPSLPNATQIPAKKPNRNLNKETQPKSQQANKYVGLSASRDTMGLEVQGGREGTTCRKLRIAACGDVTCIAAWRTAT